MRKFARSTTSGSRAAFSSTVSPVGQRGGHHQILGAGDGDGLEHQARALKRSRARLDVAVLDMNVGAHRLQTRDVDVDRPRADRAAARAATRPPRRSAPATGPSTRIEARMVFTSW